MGSNFSSSGFGRFGFDKFKLSRFLVAIDLESLNDVIAILRVGAVRVRVDPSGTYIIDGVISELARDQIITLLTGAGQGEFLLQSDSATEFSHSTGNAKQLGEGSILVSDLNEFFNDVVGQGLQQGEGQFAGNSFASGESDIHVSLMITDNSKSFQVFAGEQVDDLLQNDVYVHGLFDRAPEVNLDATVGSEVKASNNSIFIYGPVNEQDAPNQSVALSDNSLYKLIILRGDGEDSLSVGLQQSSGSWTLGLFAEGEETVTVSYQPTGDAAAQPASVIFAGSAFGQAAPLVNQHNELLGNFLIALAPLSAEGDNVNQNYTMNARLCSYDIGGRTWQQNDDRLLQDDDNLLFQES